jgi:hypothetical protein
MEEACSMHGKDKNAYDCEWEDKKRIDQLADGRIILKLAVKK